MTAKGITIDLTGDKPVIAKRGPKGTNLMAPGGAEDGAPNAVEGAPATIAAPEAQAHRKPKDEDPDIIVYAKSLSLVEIGAFCDRNDIEVDFKAPNGGVAKMRAMNKIRAAAKAGKALVK